jgi:hypothetical protein
VRYPSIAYTIGDFEKIGDTIVLVGFDFGTPLSNVSVYLSGVMQSVLTFNSTELVFRTTFSPTNESFSITVVTDGFESRPFTSLQLATPTVTSISPSNGPTGPQNTTMITINGRGFGDNSFTTNVTIGGKYCILVVFGSTQLKCMVPTGTGTNKTVVVSRGTKSSTASVTYRYNSPAIAATGGISPATNLPPAGNIALLIRGTSFHSTATVAIDSRNCVVAEANFTHILCVLPAGVGVNKQLIVTVDGQASSARNVNYRSPVLSSISPTNGSTAGGYELTLIGTGFGPGGTLAGTVYMDTTIAPLDYNQYTDTSVIVTVPEGSGSNSLLINVAGPQSNSMTFTYLPPEIHSMDTGTVLSDSRVVVTIHGLNFGRSTSGEKHIYIEESEEECLAVDPLSWTHTTMVCSMPPGGGRVSVTADIDSIVSDPFVFLYPEPEFTRTPLISGDNIVFFGQFFEPDANLTIDGQRCTATGLAYSPDVIECTAPTFALNTSRNVEIVYVSNTTQQSFSVFLSTNSTHQLCINDYCESAPCMNGATCGNFLMGYTCTCAANYTGEACNDHVDEEVTCTNTTVTVNTTITETVTVTETETVQVPCGSISFTGAEVAGIVLGSAITGAVMANLLSYAASRIIPEPNFMELQALARPGVVSRGMYNF